MKGIKLNPQQEEAASHRDGPLAVLSVAGSGKTMVLTERIIQLIQNHEVDPTSVLAITFARKAVMEIRSRLKDRLNGQSEGVMVSTFHSLGYRILKRTRYPTFGFELILEEDQLKLFMDAMLSVKVQGEPAELISLMSLARNDLKTSQDLEAVGGVEHQAAAKIMPEYEVLKRRKRLVDFDDLLCLPHRLFTLNEELLRSYQSRWRYILVDEFQDSSKVMLELVNLLSENHRNIWVAGDDDQAIHGFRGARADTFQILEKLCDGGLKTITMNRNYRSTGKIIDAANRLIRHNKIRVKKEMITGKGGGNEVRIQELPDEQGEAAFIAQEIRKLRKQKVAYRDIAVLARVYKLMPLIETAMIQHKIPYTARDGFFFQRREIKMALMALRHILFESEPDRIDLPTLQTVISELFPHKERLVFQDALIVACSYAMVKQEGVIYREDSQSLTRTYLDALATLCRGYTDLPALLEFIDQAGFTQTEGRENAVNLLTIHQAKGLQFRVVFIPGLNEGVLPHVNAMDEGANLEEERRLLYVAMTRAMENLTITYRRRQTGQDITLQSRFLKEIVF